MKVVEYWHGTIKNYRYDGDVSHITISLANNVTNELVADVALWNE